MENIFAIDLIASNILSHLSMPDIMSISKTCRTMRHAVRNLWDIIGKQSVPLDFPIPCSEELSSVECPSTEKELIAAGYILCAGYSDFTINENNQNYLCIGICYLTLEGDLSNCRIITIDVSYVDCYTHCYSLTAYGKVISVYSHNGFFNLLEIHVVKCDINRIIADTLNCYAYDVLISRSKISKINISSNTCWISHTSCDTFIASGTKLSMDYIKCETIDFDVDHIIIFIIEVKHCGNLVEQLTLKQFLPKPPTHIETISSVMMCYKQIYYVPLENDTNLWLIRAAVHLRIDRHQSLPISVPRVKSLELHYDVPYIIPVNQIERLIVSNNLGMEIYERFPNLQIIDSVYLKDRLPIGSGIAEKYQSNLYKVNYIL